MEKKYLAGLAMLVFMALGVNCPAEASLVLEGAVYYDGAQRNLIYDSVLNITWLDYTKDTDTWNNQQLWVSSLAFTINGVTYDNWRLPSTLDNGPNVVSFDGSTPTGFNVTTSEMGDLFYNKLLNTGDYAKDGSVLHIGSNLNNKDPFVNLAAVWYWSGTEYADAPNYAWRFGTGHGSQGTNNKLDQYFALAVFSGKVLAVPEPASMLLVGVGLAGLFGLGSRRRWHH